VLLSLAGFCVYKTRAGQAKVFCHTIQESTLSLIPVTEGFHMDDLSPHYLNLWYNCISMESFVFEETFLTPTLPLSGA
jgi:hypothetical protein